MNIEEAFQADLRKKPYDRATLGAYGDWLEEQGRDRRHAFVLPWISQVEWKILNSFYVDGGLCPLRALNSCMLDAFDLSSADEAQKRMQILRKVSPELLELNLGNAFYGRSKSERPQHSIRALMEGLPKGLLALDLGYNDIGGGTYMLRQVQALADGLPPGLLALKLGRNNIGNGRNGLQKLQTLMKGLPDGLLVLDLGANYIGIGSDGLRKVQAVMEGLPKGLLALRLYYNEIACGEDALQQARAVAQAECVELKHLSAGREEASPVLQKALCEAYARTIEDGTKPSLFSLEVLVCGGEVQKLSQDLLALRDEARASWERAHAKPRPQVENASISTQESKRQV